MRLVTWNMDHWRRRAELRAEAWQYLETELRPDVALLQETVPPPSLLRAPVFRSGGLLDERKAPPRDLEWGSAIVSFGPQLHAITSAKSPFHTEPVPLLRTFAGSVAVAQVGENDDALVLVSAYGLIDRGYADTTVHRILSDLTPLIDQRKARRMVIAGDLNITTQWSERHSKFLRNRHDEVLRRDRNLFERFRALGFENIVVRSEPGPLAGCGCHDGEECRHVQTQRHDSSEFPWQNDYVFVTRDLGEQNPVITVADHEAAWNLSSHCPIVVEFAS